MSVQWGMITSVVCPGGWHYPQLLSSGQTVKITGFSFEQLLENMLDFRRRHIELCGNESATIEVVRADLKDYLCKNFKQNCADPAAAGPALTRVGGIGVTNYKTPIDRAANWIAREALARHEYIDVALAAQRAQICVQCQQNVGWQTGCMPCNDNVLVRIQQMKGSMRTPYDRQLHMCRVFGWLNEVAVWLADPAGAGPQTEQSQPAHCWVKEKQNGQ